VIADGMGNVESAVKKDDVVLCPIFSIGRRMRAMSGEVLLHELVRVNQQWFLKYRISEDDLRLGFREILMKFRFFCTALSVATLGHFWVGDELLNEKLQIIWKGKKSIRLVVDREISPSGPLPLKGEEFFRGEDAEYWIAVNYPQVFMYHHIGLFLLRSNFETEYLYAEVLLNFFKIVEIVTFVRTGKRPNVNAILKEHRKLKSKYVVMRDIEESEIREFYSIRGRDAAHDWGKVRGVSRAKALECKLWAEALIMVDMKDRTEGREIKRIIEVIESEEGATGRTKGVK